MSEPIVSDSFPLSALLPKRETTAASFLTKYPEYDGRGIKIAIIDSGIDPGAAGLQTTTDGKPKVIDMMDATGAGDVDTSTVVEADADGFITGLTGTKLKIPKHWTNPTGKYYIGMKNIYELYTTRGLSDRIAKEYNEENFQPNHKTVTAEAIQELQEFQNSHLDPSQDDPEEKLIREELQSRVDFLKQMDKKFTDLGPTFDCVVFNDGTNWKAVIDTSGIGKLEECTVLGNYRDCFKYGTLSHRDLLNYAVNIHNDGKLLEIVAMCSAHGTHVASIAAAHFPNDPERNGVAPGAQIVSICIGDNRVGSMETGTALIRAMIKIIETGCHVINMSYGESSHWCEGRVLDLMHEVVNKYGIVFCVSASNSGPALSTIGTPPTNKSASMISVGAYVSPDMMAAEYSMRQKIPAMGYTWTSRGPTINGDLGVCICAPGGAITSVPNWTLKKSQLMNGTSMASPNAAGCVCILLSGLKALNIDYSPFSVKRCLENTALKIQNYCPFTHGHGLIQVEKAFEHLTQYKNAIERDVRFHVTNGNNLGVYLREAYEVQTPSVQPINIEPVFLNDKQIDNKRKVDFEMSLSLVCDKEWVTYPSFLHLTYTSRIFGIKVDPQGLEDGSVHFALIKAYDTKCIEKGPVFYVPITVIKPLKITDRNAIESTHSYKPGYLRRLFLDIPANVTSMAVNIKNCDQLEKGSFVLHTQQLSPQLSNRTDSIEKMLVLSAQEDTTVIIKLKSSRTIEVCFGKWWSSIGETPVQLNLKFYGLQPSGAKTTMLASEGISRINVISNYGFEDISPSISLQSYTQPIRSTENLIRPLLTSRRDVIPPGRQIYEIILTYSFQLSKAQEIIISCPLLSDVLYESEYESQLWMIFDANTKQYLGSGDAFPEKFSYSKKLEKGDYIVKLQIRHELVSQLEKLTELPIHLHYKLASSVSLSIYETYHNAISDGKKANSISLPANSQIQLFVNAMTEPPKNITTVCGGFFSGHLTLSKDDNRKKVEKFEFKYITDSESQKKSKEGKDSKDKKSGETDDKSLEEQYNDALTDLKISWISKLKGKQSEDLFNELQMSNKGNKQLLFARLQALDSDEERSQHLKTQISLANELLDLIKVEDLISSMAVLKLEKKDNANNTTANKNLEKQKTTAIETLVKKGIAICDIIDIQTQQSDGGLSTVAISDSNAISADSLSDDTKLLPPVQVLISDVDNIFEQLSKLIDPYDQKVAKFTERHALLHKHYGRALKLFNKLQESKASHEIELKTIEAFNRLNWKHLANAYNRSINVKYPKNYRLF